MTNAEAALDKILTTWRKAFPDSQLIVILGKDKEFTFYSLNGSSDLAFSAALTLLQTAVAQSKCDCAECAEKRAAIENFIKMLDSKVAVH